VIATQRARGTTSMAGDERGPRPVYGEQGGGCARFLLLLLYCFSFHTLCAASA